MHREILEEYLKHTSLSLSYYYGGTRQEDHDSVTSGTFSLHPSMCKGPGAGSGCELKKLDKAQSGREGVG